MLLIEELIRGKTLFKMFNGRVAYCLYMLLLICLQTGYSQDYNINKRAKIYTWEVGEDSLLVLADNDFAVPISLKLEMELENLEGLSGSEILAVIPPKASGQVIARLNKADRIHEYQCVYHWKMVLGDITKIPDANFFYALPFNNPAAYHVSQGPGGGFSHANAFAYDFPMPVGSPITAARDGVIAFVETDWETGGENADLIDKANVISVLHPDGTIGNYVHLARNGSLVKEGDEIKQGQLIGYSGNTGYSTGAHLHFEVVQPDLESASKKWVAFEWDRGLYSLLNDKRAGGIVHGAGASH